MVLWLVWKTNPRELVVGGPLLELLDLVEPHHGMLRVESVCTLAACLLSLVLGLFHQMVIFLKIGSMLLTLGA